MIGTCDVCFALAQHIEYKFSLNKSAYRAYTIRIVCIRAIQNARDESERKVRIAPTIIILHTFSSFRALRLEHPNTCDVDFSYPLAMIRFDCAIAGFFFFSFVARFEFDAKQICFRKYFILFDQFMLDVLPIYYFMITSVTS